MNQIEPQNNRPSKEWPSWFNKWVLPYVSESAMWPVLFALWAHAVMGLAVVVSLTLRANVFLGLAGMAILLSITGRAIWFEIEVLKRPGWLALFCLITWLAGILTGYWGTMYNII